MIVDCKDFPTALKHAEVDWKKKSKKNKPSNFQEATEIMCDAMRLMIISKNHKYGKNNILKFGQQGIFMRDWDKICRLEEGIINGKDIGEEGRMYNWFYHGFEDFKNNESCSPSDIMLMKKLERWLIENGE